LEHIEKKVYDLEKRVTNLEVDLKEMRNSIKKNNGRVTVFCSNCNYSWKTKSKLKFVGCPSCGNKNRILNQENKDSLHTPIPKGYYKDNDGKIKKKPEWTKDYAEGHDPFDIMEDI